jgi:hypothetical protein
MRIRQMIKRLKLAAGIIRGMPMTGPIHIELRIIQEWSKGCLTKHAYTIFTMVIVLTGRFHAQEAQGKDVRRC